MSAATESADMVAEYLAGEAMAEVRSEFVNGRIHAVPRTTRQHSTLVTNLVGELGSRLRGSPWRSYSSTQRLKVLATDSHLYPDLMVIGNPQQYDTEDPDSLVNPVAIIEVLSPSTENYDRGAKFRQYQQIPSFQEYVLVSQEEPLVERFVRQADGTWVLTILSGLAGELAFATVPARVPVADIYNGVEFPAEPPRGPRPG